MKRVMTSFSTAIRRSYFLKFSRVGVPLFCVSAMGAPQPIPFESGHRDAESRAVVEAQSTIPSPHDFEEYDVWRVRVGIMTSSTHSGAPTDDDVRVRLNGTNTTWLDTPANDFTKGSDRLYDLSLDGVFKIKDIKFLEIYKRGSNAFCIRRARLIINESIIIWDTSFPAAKDGAWLDNSEADRTLMIGSNSAEWGAPALRTNPLFTNHITRYSQSGNLVSPYRPPLRFTKAELIKRVECLTGDLITNIKVKKNFVTATVYWGKFKGAPVSIKRLNDSALKFDLDLAVDLNRGLPNPALDVNFELRFRNVGGNLVIEIRNIKANCDSSFFAEILSYGLMELLDRHINKRLKEEFGKYAMAIRTSLSVPQGVKFAVTSGCDIVVTLG